LLSRKVYRGKKPWLAFSYNTRPKIQPEDSAKKKK